ncbi:hypothetical protein GGX14DRAFT_311711, partial [Mycena pura]
FGVGKRRFRILISRPECSYDVQSKIVCAAAALHNFLRIHEPVTSLDDDDEYDIDAHPFLNNAAVVPEHQALAITTEETKRANDRRDAIAQCMWDDYMEELE